jgi:hypothetical protein
MTELLPGTAWYSSYGAVPLLDAERTLVLPLATIEGVLKELGKLDHDQVATYDGSAYRRSNRLSEKERNSPFLGVTPSLVRYSNVCRPPYTPSGRCAITDHLTPADKTVPP